jgi:Ni,Fe-hydrogenase III small subunit
MLPVTGPLSRHIEGALRCTYEATPERKLAVALGDCGCTYASLARASNVVPVDVAIPGCAPSAMRIPQGILAAIARSGVASRAD